MTIDAPIDILESQILKELASAEVKRRREQRHGRNVFLAQVGLIFTATVCLGLDIPSANLALKNTALICSAGATLAGTISGYFNFRDRWIRHVSTVGGLQAILGDLQIVRAQLDGEAPIPPSVDQLRSRLRSLLDDSLSQWANIPAAEAPKPKAVNGGSGN
jgi:hypothetical protein